MLQKYAVPEPIGVTGFEPAASCSQSRRATNCATPRYTLSAAPPILCCIEYILPCFHAFVKPVPVKNITDSLSLAKCNAQYIMHIIFLKIH